MSRVSSRAVVRHLGYFGRLPTVLVPSTRLHLSSTTFYRPSGCSPLAHPSSSMSRPAAALPYSPRGRVQCPICSVHLPSAHIQQHAAVCGLEEEKGREEVHRDEEAELVILTSQQHATRSKRKRQPQPPDEPRAATKRKQSARDRVRAQQHEASADEVVEEKMDEDRQTETLPRPLTFINSPPTAPLIFSPSSRTSQHNAADVSEKRRRIERAVITTYPPSSPVLGYGSDGTPGAGNGTAGTSQLKINIPSPSPPPFSPAQYAHFSPLTAHQSPAPLWLTYRIAAIPPSQPATGLSERTSALTFLTYNVWFEDVHQRTRTAALASLIAALQPDVVALQEVTPTLLSLLQRSTALDQYWLSPHPTTAPYFTLLLSKRQPIAMYRIPFISQMGRDLTAVVLDVKAESVGGREGGVRRLIVSTSHLESLWQSKERRAQQLKQALTTLNSMATHPHTASASPTALSSSASPASSPPSSTSLLFMGDTNLRGTDCAPLITSQHFIDLYPTLTASHPTNDAAGYTYDTVVNRMIAAMGRKNSRARYDRVLGKVGEGLEVAGMWRAGMEPIREGVWISDHFGLVTEMKVS